MIYSFYSTTSVRILTLIFCALSASIVFSGCDTQEVIEQGVAGQNLEALPGSERSCAPGGSVPIVVIDEPFNRTYRNNSSTIDVDFDIYMGGALEMDFLDSYSIKLIGDNTGTTTLASGSGFNIFYATTLSLSPDRYTVKATALDCPWQLTRTVVFETQQSSLPPPTAVISGPHWIFDSVSYTWSASVSNKGSLVISSYLWTVNGVSSGNQQSFTTQFYPEGTYTLKVRVGFTNGTQATSPPFTVIVN